MLLYFFNLKKANMKSKFVQQMMKDGSTIEDARDAWDAYVLSYEHVTLKPWYRSDAGPASELCQSTSPSHSLETPELRRTDSPPSVVQRSFSDLVSSDSTFETHDSPFVTCPTPRACKSDSDSDSESDLQDSTSLKRTRSVRVPTSNDDVFISAPTPRAYVSDSDSESNLKTEPLLKRTRTISAPTPRVCESDSANKS